MKVLKDGMIARSSASPQGNFDGGCAKEEKQTFKWDESLEEQQTAKSTARPRDYLDGICSKEKQTFKWDEGPDGRQTVRSSTKSQGDLGGAYAKVNASFSVR